MEEYTAFFRRYTVQILIFRQQRIDFFFVFYPVLIVLFPVFRIHLSKFRGNVRKLLFVKLRIQPGMRIHLSAFILLFMRVGMAFVGVRFSGQKLFLFQSVESV